LVLSLSLTQPHYKIRGFQAGEETEERENNDKKILTPLVKIIMTGLRAKSNTTEVSLAKNVKYKDKEGMEVSQAVEHLPSKCKALSSNSATTKKKIKAEKFLFSRAI
jgi:hypothetical protein